MSTPGLPPAFPAVNAGTRTTSGEATQARANAGAQANANSVFGLIHALRAMGCTVAGSDAYLALMSMQPGQAPAMPSAVLDLTPEQFLADVNAFAAAEVGRKAARARHAALRRQADGEQSNLMAAEADTYLDSMRDAFNAAAAEARAVIAQGITPDADAEQAMARGGTAAELWISFKSGSGSVATLERVANIRASLAEVTGAGEGAGADHSIGVLDTFIPEALASVRGEPTYRKWLRVAEHLELIPFNSLEPDAILQAQGHDPEVLRQRFTNPGAETDHA